MTFTKSRSTIDRDTVVDFISDALAQTDADARSCRGFNVAPAGVPVRVISNSEELLDTYQPRLSSVASAEAVGTPYRILAMTAPPDQMGELPVWNDKRCSPQLFHRILAERGLRAAYPYRRNVWQFLDTRRRCGLQLVASISDLPPWDFGAPLRQHLHWILQEGGMRLTHASTLGLQGVGVLFLGNAGAGKSGITLAGLSIGLKTVGDDYVAVSAGAKVGARCVFAIIKQDRFGLSHVPEFAARCAALPENWKGKVEIDPSHFYPDAFASELEIVACVVPRVAGISSPRVSECGRGAAMRALMRSNLHQFPGEEEDGMQFFGGILRRLPIYSIELSTDFEKNGQAVKALIESL